MKKSAKKQTFGERVLDFYNTLVFPRKLLLPGMEIIYPYAHPQTRGYAKEFYDKFYSDTQNRIFAFGINPGRFGSGTTGVPFTDPVALQEYCRIPNSLEKKRELTSGFVYEVINKLGGVQAFYGSFFLTAVCPVGFVRDNRNYNYYDDAGFLSRIRPFLVETVKKQIDFGANRRLAIVLGTGTNLKVFQGINEEYGFFEKIHALEHPRFVLQYRRKDRSQYLRKYKKIFTLAIS
ncbi:MAG: hypothetical protein G01um101438_343 [Parcubacteria group bacterium Gr01-1014_38]|nr:MAG: hypothetical protein G01um101438_343 [Parcubacteria group bacterium Gr01-1014_38]